MSLVVLIVIFLTRCLLLALDVCDPAIRNGQQPLSPFFSLSVSFAFIAIVGSGERQRRRSQWLTLEQGGRRWRRRRRREHDSRESNDAVRFLSCYRRFSLLRMLHYYLTAVGRSDYIPAQKRTMIRHLTGLDARCKSGTQHQRVTAGLLTPC